MRKTWSPGTFPSSIMLKISIIQPRKKISIYFCTLSSLFCSCQYSGNSAVSFQPCHCSAQTPCLMSCKLWNALTLMTSCVKCKEWRPDKFSIKHARWQSFCLGAEQQGQAKNSRCALEDILHPEQRLMAPGSSLLKFIWISEIQLSAGRENGITGGRWGQEDRKSYASIFNEGFFFFFSFDKRARFLYSFFGTCLVFPLCWDMSLNHVQYDRHLFWFRRKNYHGLYVWHSGVPWTHLTIWSFDFFCLFFI